MKNLCSIHTHRSNYDIYDLDMLESDNALLGRNKKCLLFSKDSNNREIFVYSLKSTILCNEFYPNCTLYSFLDSKYYNPIKEKILSLNLNIGQELPNDTETPEVPTSQESTPVFYFIYNTDNYYHFLYDTLPYLLTYRVLKKEINDLKLLMHYPHKDSNNFYRFVTELLEILGINESNILIARKNILYGHVFISSSYTHGIDSNLPPRKEIFSLYRDMANVLSTHKNFKDTPEKIYVSRRTWIHNDLSNIGTNYTSRRRLMNEDSLVDFLEKKGFVELFTENLTSAEKILTFSNARYIIGPIGGGLANVLFSKRSCKLVAIVSPTFLEVNKRFRYCLNNVDTSYFFDTSHIESSDFKKYMRIKNGNLIGEIEEIFEDSVLVSFSKDKIAGWNSKQDHDKTVIKKENCIRLDGGLNSAWSLDMEKFKEYIEAK